MVGYQKEDLRINGGRIGILDTNNRSKNFIEFIGIVKEEFECNEVFTPDMSMARIFD